MFRFTLTMEIGFNLIDGGNNLVEMDQVNQSVRLKVGNADCSDFSLCIKCLQLTPRFVVITKGSVEQYKVKVICSQLF